MVHDPQRCFGVARVSLLEAAGGSEQLVPSHQASTLEAKTSTRPAWPGAGSCVGSASSAASPSDHLCPVADLSSKRSVLSASVANLRPPHAAAEPHSPLQRPKAMPEVDATPRSEVTPSKPALTDLRVVRPKVQASPIDRRLLAKKLGLVREPEPEKPEDAAPTAAKRRRKRDVFLSLFKPSDSSLYKRKAPTPPATAAVKVPVKLPIPYRSGEHLGVLVSGARVPFSRPMHLTRRAMLMLETNRDGAIPEERELLQGFPSRLSIDEQPDNAA